jgi:hypothetical protein
MVHLKATPILPSKLLGPIRPTEVIGLDLFGFGLDFDSAGPDPPFQFSPNFSLEVDFQGSRITSDAASAWQEAKTAANRSALLPDSSYSKHEQF